MQRIDQLLQKNQLQSDFTQMGKVLNLSSKTAPLNQKAAASSPSGTDEGYDKRIDTLFGRLGAIYGNLWINLYQSDAFTLFSKKEWSQGLARFDNRIVKEALLVFRDKSAYPPTLPQFIECCKDISQRLIYSPINRQVKSPPSEEGKAHLKALLKHLNQ